jgi:hypothetical protein
MAPYSNIVIASFPSPVNSEADNRSRLAPENLGLLRKRARHVGQTHSIPHTILARIYWINSLRRNRPIRKGTANKKGWVTGLGQFESLASSVASIQIIVITSLSSPVLSETKDVTVRNE